LPILFLVTVMYTTPGNAVAPLQDFAVLPEAGHERGPFPTLAATQGMERRQDRRELRRSDEVEAD
jgi:hypothetical protein